MAGVRLSTDKAPAMVFAIAIKASDHIDPRIALAEQLQSKRPSGGQNNWQGQGTNGRSERRMYISEIRIEYFRCFGEGEDRFVLPPAVGPDRVQVR